MTLLDLRRYAIQNRVRVQFLSPDAGECMVNEHGVLKIPALAGVPQFQFDSSLAGIDQFKLIPTEESSRSQTVSRQQLESLAGGPAHPLDTAHED